MCRLVFQLNYFTHYQSKLLFTNFCKLIFDRINLSRTRDSLCAYFSRVIEEEGLWGKEEKQEEKKKKKDKESPSDSKWIFRLTRGLAFLPACSLVQAEFEKKEEKKKKIESWDRARGHAGRRPLLHNNYVVLLGTTTTLGLNSLDTQRNFPSFQAKS